MARPRPASLRPFWHQAQQTVCDFLETKLDGRDLLFKDTDTGESLLPLELRPALMALVGARYISVRGNTPSELEAPASLAFSEAVIGWLNENGFETYTVAQVQRDLVDSPHGILAAITPTPWQARALGRGIPFAEFLERAEASLTASLRENMSDPPSEQSLLSSLATPLDAFVVTRYIAARENISDAHLGRGIYATQRHPLAEGIHALKPEAFKEDYQYDLQQKIFAPLERSMNEWMGSGQQRTSGKAGR